MLQPIKLTKSGQCVILSTANGPFVARTESVERAVAQYNLLAKNQTICGLRLWAIEASDAFNSPAGANVPYRITEYARKTEKDGMIRRTLDVLCSNNDTDFVMTATVKQLLENLCDDAPIVKKRKQPEAQQETAIDRYKQATLELLRPKTQTEDGTQAVKIKKEEQ